jgi:hypothetical protein
VWFRQPILLAARLFGIDGIIERSNDQPMLASVPVQRIGHIEFEWRVSASMLANLNTIDPNSRVIVDGAEMNDQAFARTSSAIGQGSPVPGNRVERLVANAAEVGFRGERNLNYPIQYIRMAKPAIANPKIVVVEPESPRT